MNRPFCGLTGPAREDLSSVLQRMCRPLGGESASRTGPQNGSGVATAMHKGESSIVDDATLNGTYDGQPYWSCPELADIASNRGFPESLAEAYRRHGVDLLERLHGPFAIALLDEEKNEALVAIDRIGICPIYYARASDGALVFGSAAACLHAHGDVPGGISDQAIYEYLYFHMVPSPGTVFEKQHKLQPGERLVFRNGSVTQERYWTPDFDDSGKVNRDALEQEYRSTLFRSVERYLSADSTGCFLSGGIDSSTIAGVTSELRPPANTFTIGFEEEGYDETAFARLTATHFSTQQYEYFVSPADVVEILPTIATSYDEPFGNSSVVPTYYCAKLARENGVQTLLAGDGGDELFGGNVRYVTQQVFGIYERVPAVVKSMLLEPLAFRMPGSDRFPPTRKLGSYIRQATVPMPDRLQTYNYLSRTPVDEILHADFLDRVRTDGPIEAMRDTYDASTADSMLNRMLELDWKYTLADNDLRKVSRMCELAGVAVHYPLLDDELVEFSTRVPAKLKVNRFRLRHFIKHAMRDFLPKGVLQKSKHGFGLPFGIWMKSYEPLRSLAYDCLSDIGKRNIISRDYLEALVASHRSEHAHYYGEFIWVLMMLELWFKNHDSGGGPGS